MLALSDTPIVDIIKLLSFHGIEATYLVPTPTGLGKSIMDATGPLRDFFKTHGIHDYDKQLQGQDHKKQIPAEFIYEDRVLSTKALLYRPETKSGDPRIWLSRLNSYAQPYNLLALIVLDNRLYVVNTSKKAILKTLDSPATPLGKIAALFRNTITPIAGELLELLRNIGAHGYHPSIRKGDTGIGATLESLLGIKENSRKTPDYKGIEIKASRQNLNRTRAKNRVNLFSQVPDWNNSTIKKAITMLRSYGYEKDGRLQLYCTLNAITPNPQKLMLTVDDNIQILKTIEREACRDKELMIWALTSLRERMAEKHSESFWVKAEHRESCGKEEFLYYKAIYTCKPILSNIDYLLADGRITLDLTMSEKGLNGVRDHGYLFKIWPDDLQSLFPPRKEYDLLR